MPGQGPDSRGQRRRAHDRQRRVTTRIRRSIDDDAALSIALQPICSLESRKTLGVEALARFKPPPDRSPDRWFAEAEQVGLQHELELLAARKSLDLLDQLPAGTFLAINASSECLASSSFRELLSDTDGRRIVVELTEHEQIEDYDGLSAALASIRSAGVRLAVDDAGAGFASLRHILRLEPDFIKLDRTLISGIERDRTRQALAAGLTSFGDRIDVTIIAEGVERLVELETLMELGVRYGQGYFFARPAPPPLPEISAPEFRSWVGV